MFQVTTDTLVPPLLYYHSSQELEQTSTTVVGPVFSKSSPYRDVFDVSGAIGYSDAGTPRGSSAPREGRG